MPQILERLILCATSRLAQSLRWQDDRARLAAGETRWPTLNTSTVAQWLAQLGEAALLRGEDDALLSRRVLDGFQEAMLWEAVIAESIPDYASSFFDVPGMAATALEANALMVVWGVVPFGGENEDETQAFLRWRRRFYERCNEQGLIEAVRWHEALLALIERGAARLPREVYFAGFDNITPQERRLKQILAGQGVHVDEWQFAANAPVTLSIRKLADTDSERRAVAQWAAEQLARNPATRLGIVVPNLGSARDGLETVLDAMLHPALLRPARAEVPRCYNFSLGKPLTHQPLVAVAFDVIEFATGSGEVEQSRIGELLRHPCWSASVSEADARARLEAVMRERLNATTTLARVLSFAQWFARGMDEAPLSLEGASGEFQEHGSRPAQPADCAKPAVWHEVGAEGEGGRKSCLRILLAHLVVIESTRHEWKKKTLPSQWAERFRHLLRHAGWPGERSLSSYEFQAREAFAGELDKLAALDGILGAIPAREAQRRLVQLCNTHIFQAEIVGDPQIQVVGMLEAGGMHFDALWVMGMTDDVWPPPPRPNPLLPAEQQRKVNAPNASAQVQLAFARSIHGRLLQSAPGINFSFAHVDGVTELRPSPLLVGLASGQAPNDTSSQPPPPSGGGDYSALWAKDVDDSIAPPVAEGEHVRGGTGLLRAQAICPAWAFYQYRLGAKALRQPVDGIDAAARGSIVHDALRVFWQATGASSRLRAMSDAERNAAIDKAACAALDGYDHVHRANPLPPVFRKLERERLQRLLGNWLAVELQREQPFSVISCEERVEVDIDGIVCNMQIDRIDRLDDGRRIVIDYKTGAVAGAAAWAAARITDPQLPTYAAIARHDQPPAAVAFGRVLLEDARFLGIGEADGLLPRVSGIDSGDARRVFSTEEFADWQAVLLHWRSSIEAIAHEVKAGVAPVRVENETDLRYCDVLPLLRLAERRTQWEAELKE
ncbi:RecB family exonuclease [Georgfuchsia toluolica]|uniref:RecB family exonuclease n=1 Tax=Georgfuchsia toluolica TaxID=424218 RepID=A0A916N8E0_9PROT|nr:PD-(D/E)XK nuclease family protein [Georgfuchsia toluolica]CAG4882486.1 RecB family exonuclease [Georgfuchsia toluolica]